MARNGAGAVKDANGKFDSNHYLNLGLGSYTAEKFNDADDLVIESVLTNYENGMMSADDRQKLEQLTHTIVSDPNMASRVKGNFRERITKVANNAASTRTGSVDANGTMRETIQRVNGTTDTQLIEYTTRAGSTTSDIAVVHRDFRDAWQELNSGVNATTGVALTAEEKQTLRTTISNAKSTLERTTEGAEMVRNDLITTVATQTVSSGSTPVTVNEEGTKYVAQLVSKSGDSGKYNSTLTDYAKIISNGGEIKHTDFTTVTNTNGTTTYSLINKTSAPQTVISNTNGSIVDDSTPIVTNTTLDNGQVRQETVTYNNGSGTAVPLTVGDVKARIQANIDIVNNAASTTAQIANANKQIAQDAAILSSSQGGLVTVI